MTAIGNPITAKTLGRTLPAVDPSRLALLILALGPATVVAAVLMAMPGKRSITFPPSTTIVAELDEAVSTKTATIGDTVTLRTIRPLDLRDDVRLRNGMLIHGQVTHVNAGRGGWRPLGLTIHFTRLQVDRALYEIKAVPFRGPGRVAGAETANEISLAAGQKLAIRLVQPVTITP